MFEELGSVLRYISQKISELQLAELHSQLASFYEQAATAPSEEISTNITETTKRLEEAQHKVEPTGWDNIQRDIFAKFGASNLVGLGGIKSLKDEIGQFSNDPHGVSQIFSRFSTQISELKTRADQSTGNLEKLFTGGESVPAGMEKIQLVFEEKVAINKFDDLIHQAHDWDVILKTFKKMLPKPVQDPVVWKIHKGSPTIIVVAAPSEMTQIITLTVTAALSIVTSLLNIRLLKLQIQKAEMDSENTTKMLEIAEAQEEAKLEKLAEENSIKLASEAKIVEKDSITAGTVNIKQIYNFAVNGGSVKKVDNEEKQDEKSKIQQTEQELTYQTLKELISGNNGQLLLAKVSPQEKKSVASILKTKRNKNDSVHKKKAAKEKKPKAEPEAVRAKKEDAS